MDGYRIAHRSLDTIRDQMLQQCIAPRRSNLEKMIHVFFACTFLLKGHRELDKPLAVPLSHSAAASVPCIEVRQLTATRFTVPEKYEAPAGEVELTFRDPRHEDFATKVTVRPGRPRRSNIRSSSWSLQ